MSWTSPLTVASTIFPCAFTISPAAARASFSASMNGVRCATAFFITRADFTTCGKNILPAPNRSPTTLMPAMSGPSITNKGRPSLTRASSASISMYVSIPLTSACESRSSTVPLRHSSAFFSLTTAPSCLSNSPCSTNRSVASGRRFSSTSSTNTLSSGSISSYTSSIPALTMPMSMPAAIA